MPPIRVLAASVLLAPGFLLAPCALLAPWPAAAQHAGPRVVIEGQESAARSCYRAAADGRTDERAVRSCTRAIDRSSDRGNARDLVASTVNRGVVRHNRGEYALAVADYTEAIEAHGTKLAQVRVNRGMAHEAMGPGDAHAEAMARADYEAALARRPGHEQARRRLEELDRPYLERTPVRRTVVARLSR